MMWDRCCRNGQRVLFLFVILLGHTVAWGFVPISWTLQAKGCTRTLTNKKRPDILTARLSTESVVANFSSDDNAESREIVQAPPSLVGEDGPPRADEITAIAVPSARDILRFCIPAIGVWLCSPLLSLIDTSTVGLLAGTAQQAALNPATAVTDYSARVLSFLYTGTMNLVAQNKETAKPRVFGALHLSLLVGAGLGSILFVFASPMLKLLIGNEVLDPEVFLSALRYVRIRALGMPAAALIGTAQAVCLGMKDVRSPLYLILTASAVNLILDLLLVGNPNAWIGGAAGAAWATTASLYFAIALFFRFLGKEPQSSRAAFSTTVNYSKTRRRSIFRNLKWRIQGDLPTQGFLKDYLSFKNFLRLPDKETLTCFAPFVVPVTTTQVGRCSTYIAMGHVVSSSLGTISMAANQIITSIFYTLIPIADALSLTAQSFLPSIVAKNPSKEKANAIKATTMNLLKVAALKGIFLAGVVSCIPAACNFFTADFAVMMMVRKIVPVLLVIFSLHGVFCGSEGVLLAQRDLAFIGRMYAVYFAVVPFLMLKIKGAAQRGVPVDLGNVWNLFLGYQLFRITVWCGRVVWLQRKQNRESEYLSRNSSVIQI
jgi:Na+-driven multidrug efflux pump